MASSIDTQPLPWWLLLLLQVMGINAGEEGRSIVWGGGGFQVLKPSRISRRIFDSSTNICTRDVFSYPVRTSDKILRSK